MVLFNATQTFAEKRKPQCSRDNARGKMEMKQEAGVGEKTNNKRTSISPIEYPNRPDTPTTPKTSARLERLATPRSSSSWKKPILSKYSREKNTPSQDSNKRRNDSESSANGNFNYERCIKSSKTWKDQLSPKLSRLLSNVAPAATLSTHDKPEILKICPEYEDELWQIDNDSHESYLNEEGQNQLKAEETVPDILSTPIIASLINYPFHTSCPPASVVKFSVNMLTKEVKRLSDELAAKGRYIMELEEQVKDYNTGRHDSATETDPSQDNEIQQIQCLSTPLNSNDECLDVRPQQLNELVSSLNKLKNEFRDLRRSSIESIHLASDELDKNYVKIMDYVNEEVDFVLREELMTAPVSPRRSSEENLPRLEIRTQEERRTS